MIMTDQDQDGSHIKGLLINFIHHNWPGLLRHDFLEEFITPIVKVFKKNREQSFFSLPEYEEWQRNTADWHLWRTKYYKGLGTSTSKEAKEYFTDMKRHCIKFQYTGQADDNNIKLAFSKTKIEERKGWLSSWMMERKQRLEMGLPDNTYLYDKQTSSITYTDFINKEFILFSNMDNERSIPSLVDGLKPGQRKILYTCLKRNLVRELKVAQLAGSVAELSAYHHGEVSLQNTIVNLAQDFIGSNNINLLLPNGQFGTRLHGGKDSASVRYIFTQLNSLTRQLFHPSDDPLLHYLRDDDQKIEPRWYVPIIPMVLVNGAEGIGTGWSTRILNYNVNDIVNNLRRMMDGMEPQEMTPSFRGFRGVIQKLDVNRYVFHGEAAVIDEETLEITELPVKTWTQAYKEAVLEPMLNGSEKVAPVILEYREYHTDTTVRFVVKMSPQKLREIEQIGLHKFFKLSTVFTLNSMVLFDNMGVIRRYDDVLDIVREFHGVRLSYYVKRKEYMIGVLTAECQKLDNQSRFILEVSNNDLVLNKKALKVVVAELVARGFASDPVKAWKDSIDRLNAIEEATSIADVAVEEDVERDADSILTGKHDFKYLLGMDLMSVTKEKRERLVKECEKKREELEELKLKTPKSLWKEDLDKLMLMLADLEKSKEKEEKDAMGRAASQLQKKQVRGPASKKKLDNIVKEMRPAADGRRIQPAIDSEMLKKVDQDRRKRQAKVNQNGDLQAKLDQLAADEENGCDEFLMPKCLRERLSDAGCPIALKQQRAADLLALSKDSTRGKGGRGGKVGRSATNTATSKQPVLTRVTGVPTFLDSWRATAKKDAAATASSGDQNHPAAKPTAQKRSPRKASASPLKKKKKRHAAWESGSSAPEDKDSSCDNAEPSVIARERAPKRQAVAKSTVKYRDSDSSSEDEVVFRKVQREDEDQGDQSEENSFVDRVKKTKKMAFSDESD